MAAKKKKAVSAKKGRQTAEERRGHEQVAAVLLLAFAILILCMLLIKGASLWGVLHNFFFGLLGPCAFLVPPLMVYIAVMLALDKTTVSLSSKLWQCVLLIVAVSSTVHIFHANPDAGYFVTLRQAYIDGQTLAGGGILGAILGDPMERLFTDVGAKIILILALFVFLMLVTGTTVLSFFRMLFKPVKKTKDGLDEAAAVMRERAAERTERVERKKSPKIDVDMGDGYVDGQEKPESDKPLQVDAPVPRKKDRLKQAAAELLDEQPLPAKKAADLPLTEEPLPNSDAAEQPEKTEKSEKADKGEVKKTEPEENPLGAALAHAAAENADGSGYRYPPVTLLDEATPQNEVESRQEQQQTAALLVKTLNDFGVSTKVIDVSRGPAVTRYELEPSAGVKLSRITGLADDIALRLATTGVRIEAPIPNKAAVGIEVPNQHRAMVRLRELIDSPEFAMAKSKLTVALGRDIAGKIVLADLAKMPHLLIAGTTGSGKSVCTNTMIQSVLFRASPEEVRMLLIDPKQVEFGIYNGIPHLLVPVVTDPRKAAGALGWAVTEMLARYKAFADNNVRDLKAYNELAKKSDTLQPKPQILIVIDELSDLMMAASNEVEDSIVRLAQMARAAGMHLVIATQRPSVDVITGLIKANIPSRLALTVASSVDSRTILDASGADKLLGNGDMLFMPIGLSKPMRVQGAYVSDPEVEAVVEFLKSTEESEHEYDDEVIQEIERQASAAGKSAAHGDDEDASESDEMLPQAVEVVLDAGMASTSLLQRKLRLGYARAGRLIDEMERRGIVGPHEGSKPRKVIITRSQWLEMNATQDFE